VYDGERKIAAHDGLMESPTEWQVMRFEVPGTPEIQWGVGISIAVQFTLDLEFLDDLRQIDFSAAGCEFLPGLLRLDYDVTDDPPPGITLPPGR
jgi:hypothetical protein